MTPRLSVIIRLLLGALVSVLPALPQRDAGLPVLAAERAVPHTAAEIQLSFAPVVRAAVPAVVNIYSRKIVESRVMAPFFNDPFFERFFGRQFGMGAPRRRIENSLGSGVIVDPAGIIVTNRHVIADAEEVTVVLADRREFDADVLGADDRSDLAVLRIDPDGEPLTALPLRDSDDVEVGDLVLAIGNPFGVGQTVTSGIVSALARTGVGVGDLDFFIQTDAAINPGNSGGALVDVTGALIGINTAIYSRSGGSHGIGFAVPSNLVRTVVAELTGEGADRPWLGAWGREVDAEIAEALELSRPAGILVEDVYPGGPADRAGVDVGDVILAVDGHPVNSPQALKYRLTVRSDDGPLALTIRRRDREMTLRIAAEPAPAEPPRNDTRLVGNHPLSGAIVANLSPALAETLRQERFYAGVVVLGVDRGSPAQRIGLRRGDRVLAINGRPIETVADLEALAARPGRRWRMRIGRGSNILDWQYRW